MIRNDKLSSLNAFQPRAIPSARKLFERYGYSRVADGHPDNTDPYHFGTPSNPQGVVPGVGAVSLGASVADTLINLAAQDRSSEPPVQSTTESETQPEKSE